MVAEHRTHGTYLEWVLRHGENRGGRLEDFFNYLKMIMPATEAFPGTQEVRERKKPVP